MHKVVVETTTVTPVTAIQLILRKLDCHSHVTVRYYPFAVTDLGPPAPPSKHDPIIPFSHTFLPKSARVGGRRPSMGRRPPPQREILDLQLMYVTLVCINTFNSAR